jgi:integrase
VAKVLTHAAVVRLKPANGRRREVPDGAARGLHLVIEPSGVKSFGYRYRRPGTGVSANLRLGRLDVSGRETEAEPRIGDPLTLAAARALAAELERRRLRGIDPAAEHQAAKRQARVVASERESNLFPAAVRSFVDEHTVASKGRRPRGWRQTACHLGLRYPADGGEPEMIQGGLAERWRERSVTEIASHDIYSLTDEARRFGIPGTKKRTQGLSDARARKMRDALGSLFGWLLTHRKITVDPCLGVWRPGPSAPRTRVLDAAEIRWFWRACDAVGEPYAAALRLLLLTGCRLREIALLKWSELSDDFAVLRLPAERVKNSRPHEIVLPQLARDIIGSVLKIEGCDFVLSSNGRTAGGSWNRVKRKLDEYMLEAAREERGEGAAIEHFRLHDLRRTTASGMQQIGVRTEVIERALNHTSGSFRGVAGVYQTDPLTDDVRAALVKWSEHIQRVVSGESAKVVPMRRA